MRSGRRTLSARRGTHRTFPIVADPDRKVANLYGMMHPAHDEVYTVRTVFVIDPTKKIRLMITYPQTTGRNDGVIIVPAVSDAEAKEKFPTGWKAPTPYLRLTKPPSGR